MAANTIAIVIGKIIRRFADANAFSEDTAQTLEELNLKNRHGIIMNGLIRRGTIIETRDGKYFLSYNDYQRRQRRKRIIIPIILISLFIIIILAVFQFYI